jgi:hypothetical protein
MRARGLWGWLFRRKKQAAVEPTPSADAAGADETFERMAEFDYDRLNRSRRTPSDN